MIQQQKEATNAFWIYVVYGLMKDEIHDKYNINYGVRKLLKGEGLPDIKHK